jgi:hypothetical protein
VRATAADHYRFETLVTNIVTSAPFQMARSPAPPAIKSAKAN